MVPSLVGLCLRRLAALHIPVHLPARLSLDAPDIPDDVHLWAAYIQVAANLPPEFAVAPAPVFLGHPVLGILHAVPRFPLITVLVLPASPALTDASLPQITKQLPSLALLDASRTCISSHALAVADALTLRVLFLRDCRAITDHIFLSLPRFPLLAVVDLRGTACTELSRTGSFSPATDPALFSTRSIGRIFNILSRAQPALHTEPRFYRIHINTVQTPSQPRAPSQLSRYSTQDAFYIFTPTTIKRGNTHVLQNQIETTDAQTRHERNKAAWYARQSLDQPLAFDHSSHSLPPHKSVSASPVPEPHRARFASVSASDHQHPRRPRDSDAFIHTSKSPHVIATASTTTTSNVVNLAPSTTSVDSVNSAMVTSSRSLATLTTAVDSASAPLPANPIPQSVPSTSFYSKPLQSIAPQLQTTFAPSLHPLMLSRHPPPYSALDEFLEARRVEQEERKEKREQKRKAMSEEGVCSVNREKMLNGLGKRTKLDGMMNVRDLESGGGGGRGLINRAKSLSVKGVSRLELQPLNLTATPATTAEGINPNFGINANDNPNESRKLGQQARNPFRRKSEPKSSAGDAQGRASGSRLDFAPVTASSLRSRSCSREHELDRNQKSERERHGREDPANEEEKEEKGWAVSASASALVSSRAREPISTSVLSLSRTTTTTPEPTAPIVSKSMSPPPPPQAPLRNLPPPASSKPLLPISTLRVPSLPQELMRRNSEAEDRSIPSPGMDMDTDMDMEADADADRPRGSVRSKKKLSTAVGGSSLAKKKAKTVAGGKGGNSSSAGFDWKSWGSGSKS